MDDAPEPSIMLHPHSRRVQVVFDVTLLGDTTRAIELRETGYPPRPYLPRDDMRMELLTPFNTVTHCPLKGDASYHSFGEAWSYERLVAEMETPAGKLALYDEEVK